MFAGHVGNSASVVEGANTGRNASAVIPPSSCIAYTGRMRVSRLSIVLLVAAVLFGQIVSAMHMVGHLHVTAHAVPEIEHPPHLTPIEHAALHGQALRSAAMAEEPHGSNAAERVCAIYHVHATSQCLMVAPWQLPVAVLLQAVTVTLPVPAAPVHRHTDNAIRGPPVFS